MPTSRRLLVLCSPASGNIVGVQMIQSALDIGMSGSEESNSKAANSITGTADYKSIRQAMKVSDPTSRKGEEGRETHHHMPSQDGQEYARSLHGAIKSQMASKEDTAMETV